MHPLACLIGNSQSWTEPLFLYFLKYWKGNNLYILVLKSPRAEILIRIIGDDEQICLKVTGENKKKKKGKLHFWGCIPHPPYDISGPNKSEFSSIHKKYNTHDHNMHQHTSSSPVVQARVQASSSQESFEL